MDSVRKSCAPLPQIFFRPRSKWPRPQSYPEESQTESTLHRQAGIVRRLARRRTIQLVGTLCVNACSVVCVKSMILACGFVFWDNQIRVAREAPRRPGRETPNRRFSLPTFEHVGAANLCRLKPLRRVHARLIYGPLLNLFVSGDRQPRPAAKPG